MARTKLKLFKVYLPVGLHERLNAYADDLAMSANHLAIFLIGSGLPGIKSGGCDSPASEPFPFGVPDQAIGGHMSRARSGDAGANP